MSVVAMVRLVWKRGLLPSCASMSEPPTGRFGLLQAAQLASVMVGQIRVSTNELTIRRYLLLIGHLVLRQ